MNPPPQLALHEWSSLRGGLIWIYDLPVASASQKQSVPGRQTHYAWFLREGHCRFEHAGRTFHILPGMWFFVPFGRGQQEFSQDARMISVHFFHQWPSGESFIRNETGLLFPGTEHPGLERCAARLARLVRGHFPDSSRYKLQQDQLLDGRIFLRIQTGFHAWLENWLDACFRHGLGWSRLRSGDDRLLQAARVLNDAPLDQGFPRAALLDRSRLSEVHLTRLFFGAFGLTPRKYWDRRRLEFARNCLETSLMPVKEIAWRCGFRSDAHFAVWFRRLTRRRPGQFRPHH